MWGESESMVRGMIMTNSDAFALFGSSQQWVAPIDARVWNVFLSLCRVCFGYTLDDSTPTADTLTTPCDIRQTSRREISKFPAIAFLEAKFQTTTTRIK